MDLLILTAGNAEGDAAVDGVTFQVTGDGQTLEVDGLGGVRLPASPRPLRLVITVRPPPQFFELRGEFDYHGQGDLRPAVDDRGQELASSEFAPVRGTADGLGNAVMSLMVFVSRIRDVTARVLDLLQTLPDRRPEYTPPTNLALTPRTVSVVTTPPIIRNDDLTFVGPKRIEPDAETIVFEVNVEPAPKLIAVVWPEATPRSYEAPATPVLVYFHPNAAQNRETHYRGAYPFSWDFLFFGIITYLRYARADPVDPDPLHDIDGLKGLSYQMKESGKNPVLVLPVNRLFSEVGVFLKAESMESILKEIVAFMFRKRRVYKTPDLGRIALASFSAGNTLVTTFLNRNLQTGFAQNKLLEVYNFDLPLSVTTGDANMRAWTQAVRAWAATGNTADKRVRAYTQANFANLYRQLLGVTPPARTPYEISDATGNRTAVVVPIDAWRRISRQIPDDPLGAFQVVHQLIADLLLTDALRRSGFP